MVEILLLIDNFLEFLIFKTFYQLNFFVKKMKHFQFFKFLKDVEKNISDRLLGIIK